MVFKVEHRTTVWVETYKAHTVHGRTYIENTSNIQSVVEPRTFMVEHAETQLLGG